MYLSGLLSRATNGSQNPLSLKMNEKNKIAPVLLFANASSTTTLMEKS